MIFAIFGESLAVKPNYIFPFLKFQNSISHINFHKLDFDTAESNSQESPHKKNEKSIKVFDEMRLKFI